MAGARRMGFRKRTKESTAQGGGRDVLKEVQRLNEGDKLKGNTFGARGSTRSGSKDSRAEGLRGSKLEAKRKRIKVDYGGLR